MPGIAEGMVLAMLVLWWLLFWFWLWLWLFFFVFFLKNDDDGEYKRDTSRGHWGQWQDQRSMRSGRTVQRYAPFANHSFFPCRSFVVGGGALHESI